MFMQMSNVGIVLAGCNEFIYNLCYTIDPNFSIGSNPTNVHNAAIICPAVVRTKGGILKVYQITSMLKNPIKK